MKINWLLDDYLNELDYWLEAVEFLSSSPTTISNENYDSLLKKDESLPHLDKRVSFYDNGGQTYVANVPLDESMEILTCFLKQQVSVQRDDSFIYLDAIADLIQSLYPTYKVYGYYHKLMDKMLVIDNKEFLEELLYLHDRGHRNFEIGEFCHGVPLPSGEIDLIGHNGNHLLHIPYLNSIEYELSYRYFDIHTIDGQAVFQKVTMENLALILYSLKLGLNPEDIKHHFLDYDANYEQPTNMSELRYYRYYTSEKLMLKTKYDICCIAKLEEADDTPGFEGEYRFNDVLDFRESSRVILTEDILNVLLNQYVDKTPKDVTNTLSTFSKAIYDLAEELGYTITKKTRWLRGRWFMENVEINHEGITKYVRRRKDNMSYDAVDEIDTINNPTCQIEIVYDLNKKSDDSLVFNEVDIAKLVVGLIHFKFHKSRF